MSHSPAMPRGKPGAAVDHPDTSASPTRDPVGLGAQKAQPQDDNEAHLNGLVGAQNRVLHKMVKGAGLSETLLCVAQSIEEVNSSTLCAIVVFDEASQNVELVAAPGMSQKQVEELEHIALGPAKAGVEAVDMPSDPDLTVGRDVAQQCDEIRRLAISHQQFPVWNKAIRNDHDAPLGVFVLCSHEDRSITNDERRALHAMMQLSRFAIEFERRNAALKSADARFASLAASIPGVVYQRIVDPDGRMRYSYISEGAKDLFGVPPEEIIADPQALFDCHGPEYAATFRDRLLQASRELTLWDVEATIITRDGRQKFTHAIARPTRRPNGSVQWDGVILDATRIKEAELEAAAAEARTRDTIVESMPQGFVLYDQHDRLVTWNTKFLDFYPQLASVMTAGTSYTTVVEAEIEHGLDVEVLTPLDESGAVLSPEQRLAARLERRSEPVLSVERRLSDGRWILISEHRTADGATVILHTDVTELKDREAALERSNKELQDFASVASHDLQEPLRKIEAFVDRLRAKYSDELGEDGKMYIDRMQNAASRMRSLINDLLSYSRVTTKAKPFARVDLAKCTREVLSDLQVAVETTSASIEVEDLPTIDADPTQMRMLLQNLIANAIKFHQDDVAPHIKIAARIHDRPPPGSLLEHHRQKVCEIRVQDNGIGFDMKYMNRIFGIFQRLHGRNAYEGTGVGLATCRKIVERHNGTITAESSPGNGATFIIFLAIRQDTSEQ